MTIFDGPAGRGRVIDAGAPRGLLTLIGFAIVGLVLLVVFFNSVT